MALARKLRDKTERDQFHEVVLHSETLVFVTTQIVATVTEVNSGSTFPETCLATEIQQSFTKPTMLHSATLAETCFAVLLHISFRSKFQRVTAT